MLRHSGDLLAPPHLESNSRLISKDHCFYCPKEKRHTFLSQYNYVLTQFWQKVNMVTVQKISLKSA